jgi:hypothetical protein
MAVAAGSEGDTTPWSSTASPRSALLSSANGSDKDAGANACRKMATRCGLTSRRAAISSLLTVDHGGIRGGFAPR